MSVLAKVVLGSSCVFAVSVISYVHYKQDLDRKLLYEGVLRDVERQQKRKMENLYILQKQKELTKQLKEENSSIDAQM